MSAIDRYRSPVVQAIREGKPAPATIMPDRPKPSERLNRLLADKLAAVVDQREAVRLGRKLGTAASTIVPINAPAEVAAAGHARVRAGRDPIARLKAELAGSLHLLSMVPALGAAGRGGRLAMDKASRMSRAKNLGFAVDTPMYHGTSLDFKAFDLRKTGQTTGTQSAQLGVWLSPEPEHAAKYADAARQVHGGAERVLPLLVRPGRAGEIRLQGSESDRQVAATLAEAFDQGFDTVRIIPHTGGKGDVVVKNPNQLRSVHAKFDPKKRDSSDLLAGIGAGAGAGLAGSLVDRSKSGQETRR